VVTSADRDRRRLAFPSANASDTKDGSAAIAEAVLGNQAAGYFCDGRNVESWLGGTDDGADITVKSKSAMLEAGRPLSSTRVQDHDRMARA
jgi:hypothetical protein